MNSLKIKPAALRMLAFAAVAAFIAGGDANAQSNCITFESPLAGSVLSEPSCTISLNVDCRNVTKIDLQARYIPEHSDSAVIVSLSTISRPPYKLIWNTHNLPNQLFTGIGILAEASITGEAPQIARQEGIFLTHNKVPRSSIAIPYSPGGQNTGGDAYARQFVMDDAQQSAIGLVVWNEKELIFQVSVKDPSFYSNQPGRSIADAGLEVMIDQDRKRSPYPTDNTLIFVVPLSGTPYAINYRAEIADGAFKLVPQPTRVHYAHSVGISEFKGYNVRFSVPKEAFGKAIPDTFGCNLAIRTLDANGKVHKISLSGDNVYEMYSPFVWSEYHKLSKPLFMNSALQWIVFSAAGFLLALGVYALISKLRKPQLISSFERSEEDKVIFERVNAIIEQELIKRDLAIDYVANRSGMDPQSVNNLIKRNTGFTFINYLQLCRTEVAKERLRSSRSSEKSIADLCGFESAMEMERCFAKFHRTTPYKFRTQQQVA
ncbi:MAG: helix-turn-helix domain-containing protein [Chitinispirillales bacterium]|nr:helix-turn-helix domain-containing protein [Chitinispirillales bacterium]